MISSQRSIGMVLLACLLGLPSVVSMAAEAPAAEFFVTLQELCGVRFEGEMTYPQDGQDDFAGKLLVATIERCDDDEIRIPFTVGEDRSRTWILSRDGAVLRLQHDHRHADGTPDEITMYGGVATSDGTALEQRFVADEHTAAMIPEAVTNVWTLRLDAEASTLTYHLERHAAPRFTAVLSRVP